MDDFSMLLLTKGCRYECPQCDAYFSEEHEFEDHKLVHELRPFICELCRKCFKTKYHRNRHLRTHNPSEKCIDRNENRCSYKCTNCNATFDQKEDLDDHMEGHNLRPYVCEVCLKAFKTKYHKNRHLNTHRGFKEDESSENFECLICKETFSAKPIFISHMKIHMMSRRGEVNCVKQEESQSSDSASVSDDQIEEDNDTNPGRKHFLDDEESDGEIVNISDTLQIQLSDNLLNNEALPYYPTGPELKCEICAKVFRLKSSLTNHKKVHQKLEEKKEFVTLKLDEETNRSLYECKICNRNFKRNQYLQLHLRTHTNEKPFMCEICGKSFSIKQNLLVHLRIHGENSTSNKLSEQELMNASDTKDDNEDKTAEDSLPPKKKTKPSYYEEINECRICAKHFTTKQNLQVHLKTHLDVRDFICDICNKGFRTKQHLDTHKFVHQDRTTCSRPFSCVQCGKSFTTKQNLQVHMKIHTDIRDFECDICPKSFRTKQQLEVHKSIHSGKKKKRKSEAVPEDDIAAKKIYLETKELLEDLYSPQSRKKRKKSQGGDNSESPEKSKVKVEVNEQNSYNVESASDRKLSEFAVDKNLCLKVSAEEQNNSNKNIEIGSSEREEEIVKVLPEFLENTTSENIENCTIKDEMLVEISTECLETFLEA